MSTPIEVVPFRYNTVAASQTAQKLVRPAAPAATGGQAAGIGQVGDILEEVVIMPSSVSPGVVSIIDGSTTIFTFAGGTNSLLELRPLVIRVRSRSLNGAWAITTGASVTVLAYGYFS